MASDWMNDDIASCCIT